jgi:GDP-D-glucose phosphorylase
MVKLEEDFASGETCRSLPVFHIDDCSAEDLTCCKALNKCIHDALATANTKDAGVLLYTLPHALDARVCVASSGNVYIVASNPWRKMKRVACTATEVSQPFEDASFHFLKADVGECFAWLRMCAPLPSSAQADPMNDTLLLINNAPLTASHFLVVPQPAARLPQVLTPYAVRVAVKLCRSLAADGDGTDGSSDVLLGFNSVCAFASVNHLHLHAYRLALSPQQKQLLNEADSGAVPAKHCATMPLHSSPNFPVSISLGQVPGLRVDKLSSEEALNVLLAVVDVVQSHNCAHNVVFFSGSCGDVSAVVYCREKAVGVKDAASLNVALSELSGHVFAKSIDVFERYSGDELDSLIEEVQLPPDVYRGICDDVVERVLILPIESNGELQGLDPVTAKSPSSQREQLVEVVSQLQVLRSHLQQEMDFLKAQIGEMKTASEEAKAALAQAAEATARQCKSSKEAFSASETAVVAPSAGINYVLFGVIVVFAGMACHKYFGASLF